MPRAVPRSSVLLALAAVVGLAGCGASEPVEAAASPAAAGDGATRYPLTIDNCGQRLTVDAAPQRVVSLDQGSTEILLSLGLGDRLVGTASWTDPVLEPLAAANASVPRLADNAPTYEVVLGTDPDFVTASFGRHYKVGGVAERARFAETGIESYLSPTDCDHGVSVNGGGKRTEPVTMDAVYAEIRELAEVFDVAARGEQLVEDLQARRAAALEGAGDSGTTVAFWFADTKAPYVAGGLGSANLLTGGVGARNVFADLTDQDWPAVGWETVVERDPQYLVLGDLARDRFPGDRLADKEAFLAADPLTSTMTAVRERNYVVLHGAEMNPSIRAVDGLEKIAAALREGSGA
ncbi:iron complex transport system substrate-binding protein [Kineococcus radiotolerans]|uniref:Iron complex transport system substrate-binding protein n=1 Tax=Kineococcus radiotolerans TaxID=131568 RepID=A0A7W4TLB2_KINRA|nr:ABC transporter substrate-binding protein [Kineococcus radiotolerans]MBB2900925.1 iron complex transport system substrate-binding protein [Kineococcus radiotolerans]